MNLVQRCEVPLMSRDVFRLCCNNKPIRPLRFVQFMEAVLEELKSITPVEHVNYIIISRHKGHNHNKQIPYCILFDDPWSKREEAALLYAIAQNQLKLTSGYYSTKSILNIHRLWNSVRTGDVRLEITDLETACRHRRFTIQCIRGLNYLLAHLGHKINVFASAKTGVQRPRLNVTSLRKEIEDIGIKWNDQILSEIRGADPILEILHSSFQDKTLSVILVRIRAVTPLRWGDGEQILQLFRSMIKYSTQRQEQQGIPPPCALINARTHVDALYSIGKVLFPRSASLLNCFDTISREEMVEKIYKHRSECPYLRDVANTINQFTSKGPWKTWLRWSTWPTVSSQELGYVGEKRKRCRDVFTKEEIERLYAYFEKQEDNRSAALLRFFIHTGARRRAISLVKVADVLDRSNNIVPWVTLIEKFRKRRCVRIDPLLAEALRLYTTAIEIPRNAYLFHHPTDCMAPIDEDRWFKMACKNCGLSGDHLHLHALRRTVITWLYEAGNSVQLIRHWIGHGDTKTTQHYIEQTPEQICDAICMPWCESGVLKRPINIPSSIDDIRKNLVSWSSTSSSSSGTNDSEQQHKMQVQLIRRVFDLYDDQCKKVKYIMDNVLTDVQRRAVQQWVDETEMKKSLEQLRKDGMLSDSDSDGD